MATTPTVTGVLEEIFSDAILPALGAAFPWLGALLKIPIIGSIVSYAINGGANWLIANGVIEVKVGLIAVLDGASQAKWASEIALLKQIQAAGATMTPAQQGDYDAALQNLVKSRGGIANA
jgi:hypothetical protein